MCMGLREPAGGLFTYIRVIVFFKQGFFSRIFFLSIIPCYLVYCKKGVHLCSTGRIIVIPILYQNPVKITMFIINSIIDRLPGYLF